MAPKKRKRTVQTAGSTPQNPIRVKCPACEKEVPSFFVNSHLDLECPVLTKPCVLPGLPAPSPSVGKNFGCHAPSKDQLQGKSTRIDDSIIQYSLEDECSLGSLLSKFDEAKSGEGERDEDVATGIAAHNECVSYGVRGGVFGRAIQPEMPRNDSVSFKNREPENIETEGNCSRTAHFPRAGTPLPSLSCESVSQRPDRPSARLGKPGDFASISGCFPSFPPPRVLAPKGLQVVEDFITREEEEHLLHCLDADISNPWKLSKVNGIHQGKAYGNHIYGDYKRMVVSQANSPMPEFVLPYIKRMRDTVAALKGFFPNEMNSIDYRKGNGHYLKAHMDDRQLSGKILVNLSLAGGCFMTYTRELGVKEAFRVKLAPRSLQILTGEIRYSYTHGIQRNDILDPRRVSMTFRQSVEITQNVRLSRLH